MSIDIAPPITTGQASDPQQSLDPIIIAPDGSLTTTFYSPGYGAAQCWGTSFSYGLQLATSEDETIHGRVMYTTAVSSPDFSIGIGFGTWASADIFMQWLEGYGARISDPDVSQSPMTVTIPSSKFSRSGIPSGGIERGDSVGKIAYTFTINFTGTIDPAQAQTNLQIAANALPFYPTGNQASGGGPVDKIVTTIDGALVGNTASALYDQQAMGAGAFHLPSL